MYSLFSNPLRSYSGLMSDAAFLNIKNRMIEDVTRIIEYYHTGTFFTRNDHILVKLIKTIATPLSYDLARYHEVTLARSLYAANALQLTSSIHAGRWFHGQFYYDCPERILAYNGLVDPEQVRAQWKHYEAVKVLECPVSNLNYLQPVGLPQQSETGLAVIGIELDALMIQYRCFMEEQYQFRAQDSGYSLLDAPHFVGRYVLPNMLKSQTDLALFNRMYNLLMGKPMGQAYRRHPFHVSDYRSQLDKVLDLYLKRLGGSKKTLYAYQEQLPYCFQPPLSMPDILDTRQVAWALFLTRLKAMEFFITLAGKTGLVTNRGFVNELKIDIRRFSSEKVFEVQLTQDMYLDLKFLFDDWATL